MFPHKNILNGLGRAVYGGKPHNVPKALQSVNMKNTSEWRRREGARPVHTSKRRHVADMSYFPISVYITPCSAHSAFCLRLLKTKTGFY